MSHRLIDSYFSAENYSAEDDEIIAGDLSAEEAEAALAVEEAANAVEMADLTVEELQHAAGSLESIQTYIEGVMEQSERGLSAESAQAVALAHESAVGTALPNPVASLESFGADSTRMEATEHSLEGIGETLKKVGKSIIDAIKKAMKAIADFFKNLFSGVKKSRKQLDDLTKALEKKKSDGAATEEKEVEVVSAKALANSKGEIDLNDGCKQIQDFYKSHVDTMLSDVETYMETMGGVIAGMSETVKDLQKQVENGETPSEDDLKKMKDKFSDDLKNMKTTYSKKSDLPKVADLPGQVAVSGISVTDPVNDEEVIVAFSLDGADDAKDPNEKISMPSLDDAIEASKCADALLATIEDGEKRRKTANEAREKVIESMEGLMKAAGSDSSDEGQKASKFLKDASSFLNKAMKMASKNFLSGVQKVDNNTYKFARASMKTLKKVESAYAAS